MNKFLKILGIILGIVAVITGLLVVFYLKIIPKIVESQKFNDFVKDKVKQTLDVDLTLNNPKLITGFTNLKFSADNIEIKKQGDTYFATKKIFTDISLKRISKKRIILQQFTTDYIFADVDKIMSLIPKDENKKSKPSDWKFRWFTSFIQIKDSRIKFSANDMKFDILGKNLTITKGFDPKYAHFDINATVTKNNKKILVGINDNNSVYIKDKMFHIDNCLAKINDSVIKIQASLDEEHNFTANLLSNKFSIATVADVIDSNIIVSNGHEILKSFADIKGSFDFNIKLENSKLSGDIKFNNAQFKISALKNLPITLNKGLAKITPNEVTLTDFDGFYGKNKNNTLTASGSIKNYTKSADTDVMVIANATDELTKDYISKLIGIPITLTGNSKTVFRAITEGSKIDLKWMFKLAKGNDILFDGMSFTSTHFDRVLMAEMGIINNIFNIKSIDYYIAPTIDANSKNIKPILTVNGNLDLAKNGQLMDIGFKIPKPLPSEFLNMIVKQRLFRKGTITGDLKVLNSAGGMKLQGNLEMDKVLIPSQRLSVRQAKLTTDDTSVNLSAEGRYKRANYNFSGKLQNSLITPIVVKDAELQLDNIDVERMLASFNNSNNQPNEQVQSLIETKTADDTSDEITDDDFMFNTDFLVIENSVLKIVKGNYKNLNFGNINANMRLDRNGVFTVHSNRFDFAEGISTLRSVCDLKNNKYNVRLGVRDVNSDLISSVILGLPNEISGKASGLIVLDTDKTMKLNGDMNFTITDGVIQKIGLVEYLLRFTSFFRNPLAMVSPTTISNLVNVPSGNFDNISGELSLKDNVIDKIMLKSTAPLLSTVIVGRYDIEKNDAALRIYTKFSTKTKGVGGILNNISLNGLANAIPLGNKNSKNYYEAELKMLPPIEADEKDCQVYLTTVDGDLTNNNFISSLKRIE